MDSFFTIDRKSYNEDQLFILIWQRYFFYNSFSQKEGDSWAQVSFSSQLVGLVIISLLFS